jgi:enoyl-CoA hydratase/carnithine racemase
MEAHHAGAVLESRPAEHVAMLSLSNPGKLNSFTPSMWEELTSSLKRLGAPGSDVRCIVISGADDSAFAAGSDITEFRRDRASIPLARVYGEVVSRAIDALEACDVPMVARIRGACVGGGLLVASWCDIQIASEKSKFGVPVNRLGLVMAHAEMKGILRRAGDAVVREVLLEGRIYTAVEALGRGLVNRVIADDQLDAEVDRTVTAIVRGAPLAARWHKRFIRRLHDPAPLTPAEIDEAYACFETRDYFIGLDAFDAKTHPQFTGA